ncbi:uncharacterized protein TA14325 [Theileria annulata]|uniref:Uncharacterized protein n=1 Tax=Theileria annulata TaxID=5874 RepID=Q4UEZ9_THEAN|nr:uncharacterized protein TA14325 [Theileria annulata]CAI74340.1 hypothetical protein TA14325 [Theileria annulata]|eukprot:XP_952072.1 hypothetical protein TA14325 [Theileria annulata]
MATVTVDDDKKLKSRSLSTETMDGIPEFDEEPETQTRGRSAWDSVKITITAFFLTFALLLLVVLIYEIRGHKNDQRKRDTRRYVNEELKKFRIEDKQKLNKIIVGHLENLAQGTRFDKIELTAPENVENRQLKKESPLHFESNVNSFTLRESSPYKSFDELEYKKVSYNCYRKDLFRQNINGTGTNLRFIAKSSKIPEGSSENSGKCATSYYWIYYTPETQKTRIYSMGPYYGHHEVKMVESMFTPIDKEGNLTLTGCVPPIDNIRKDYDWNEEYKFIRRTAYITEESPKFRDFVEFQEFLDRKIEEEVKEYDEKIRILSHDSESVQHYSTLKEATNCVYSI